VELFVVVIGHNLYKILRIVDAGTNDGHLQEPHKKMKFDFKDIEDDGSDSQ
jgi:hypothetical protein